MNHFRGILKSKDEAVWQYLIDHAVPCRVGYKVKVYLKNRNEFEAKVRYRMEGNERYDERKLEAELQKQCEDWAYGQAIAKRKSKVFDDFRKSKKLKNKIIWSLYNRTKKYISK